MKQHGNSGFLPNSLKILILAIVAAAAVSIPLSQAADTKTVTVEVSITSLSQITLSPSYLTFYSLTPGTFSSESKIDIRNTGSDNITQLYAYPDTLTDESIRPYGFSNSTYYAAGGVLIIRNETNATHFWAGRIEWNSTEDISNMVKTGVTSPVAWGFLKNTSIEYNWLVGNGTPTTQGIAFRFCNTSGTQFAIENDVDNGTAGSRTPTTGGITLDGSDDSYSYFSVSRNALPNQCVAVSANCGKVYMYKYDKRAGFSTCLNTNYLQEGALQPGEIHSVNMSAYIPLGIPATNGSLNQSTFTITGT